jgi:membrane protein required for colicin V production
MTPTDWLLLAVIGVSAVLGLIRGFIGVLASLLAWLLAGWAASRFGAQLALWLSQDDVPGAGQVLAGYALSFLVVLLFVGAVGWGVRKLVQSAGLSGLDRTMGLALGLARGGFIACVLVLLMGLTTLPRDADWRASRVLPLLLPGARWLSDWLPAWAAAELDFGVAGNHSSPLDDGMPSPPPAGV